jgi:hypothetical protein
MSGDPLRRRRKRCPRCGLAVDVPAGRHLCGHGRPCTPGYELDPQGGYVVRLERPTCLDCNAELDS